MLRFLTIILLMVSAFAAGNARADVAMTFYSHEFGKNFPHAFFTLKGQLDDDGQWIDSAYGFTATTTSPAILMGSVKGHVNTPEPKYIANSNPHFNVKLSDAEYVHVMEMVKRWQNLPSKSYNLGKRNCIHFVMDAALTINLAVNQQTKFLKRPRSFLNEVMSLNPQLQKTSAVIKSP